MRFGEQQPEDQISAAPGEQPPDFLEAPGQGEFVLGALVRGGKLEGAGYLDEHGVPQTVSGTDRRALEDVAAAGGGRDIALDIGEYRVHVADGPPGVRTLTGVRTNEAAATPQRLDLSLLAASVLALILAALAAWLLVKRTLAPLDRVAQVADAVAGANLSQGNVAEASPRVPSSVAAGTDEVGTVARALNAALDNVESSLRKLDESERQVRRFVADASHELRTPLTSIRGYA